MPGIDQGACFKDVSTWKNKFDPESPDDFDSYYPNSYETGLAIGNDLGARSALDAREIKDEDAPLLRENAPYRPIPDAFAYGRVKSGSINTPIIKASVTLGAEIAWHAETNEVVIFLIPGADLQWGLDSGVFSRIWEAIKDPDGSLFSYSSSSYIASIGNVDNLATDYSGLFLGDTTTAALKHGIMYGEAVSPEEYGIPLQDRQLAYSNVYGYASGYAVTHNSSATYYYPVFAYQP